MYNCKFWFFFKFTYLWQVGTSIKIYPIVFNKIHFCNFFFKFLQPTKISIQTRSRVRVRLLLFWMPAQTKKKFWALFSGSTQHVKKNIHSQLHNKTNITRARWPGERRDEKAQNPYKCIQINQYIYEIDFIRMLTSLDNPTVKYKYYRSKE